MPDDLHGMRLALEEARRAYQCGEVPIGAVILDDAGSVISSGYNLRETEHDATAHAELIAIRRACKALGRWRLTGLTLYVTIEPCPMCAGAILQARIPRLSMAVRNPKAGFCGSVQNILQMKELNHRVSIEEGVKAEEARMLLQDFFLQLRKK